MTGIYLDFNATTPLDTKVKDSICFSLNEAWANPSSNYEPGKIARKVIEQARKNVAEMINSPAQDIIFTSGGTESNNWVIQAVIKNWKSTNEHRPHFITSNIEHDSVKLPLMNLSKEEVIDVTFVPVDKKNGRIHPSDVIAAIQPSTCLITIMLANNETGIIQPIEDIVENVRNHQRGKAILIHTDAAQAIGKIEVNVQDLGVDFLTIVGHKFYGPRIGALYVKGLGSQTPVLPLFYGGGQERGYRPGTENTPMIAGLGKAAELVTQNLEHNRKHMDKVRNYFESRMQEEFPKLVHINSRHGNSPKLPNTCNFSFLGSKYYGYRILKHCKNIQASTGAACHKDIKPSEVLLNSGIPVETAANSIRISVGRETTINEIDRAIKELKEAYEIIEKDD